MDTTRQNEGSARETLERLGRSAWAFANCEIGGRAIAHACGLLGLLLSINGLNVINSYVGRDFMTAIAQRDSAGFVRQALLYAVVFLALTAAAAIYRFTEERLGLMWRKWLTTQLVDSYLDGHVYYRLNVAGGLANPDQRIADDVRSFTTNTLSLALIFLNGLFTILAFSGVLWSISRVLFMVAAGYAALGSWVAIVVGRSLVGLNYMQSDREADFRTELVEVRENAELVAMLDREPHLLARLRRHLDALTDNLKRIIAVNRNLGFFTTGYNYFIQLIPVLVVAPLFIAGTVEFGVISQSAMAFAHLVGAFSVVVTQFPQLSSYAAVLARLNALTDAAQSAAARGSSGITVIEDDSRFAFERLTLREPHDGTVLVRQLSLEVPAGAYVLVRVPTQVVAAALQRAVVGIWESGEGCIVRPHLGQVMLISDRPYLPAGTLRELLVGVDCVAAVPEDEIDSVLHSLGADGAVRRVGGLDVERDWDDLLSLEEQRLIGVARVLLVAPRFIVLAYLEEGIGGERSRRVLGALTERGVGCLEIVEKPLDGRSAESTVEISADGAWTRISEKART